MRFFSKTRLAALLSLALIPQLSLAANVSLTWDGTFVSDPAELPEEYIGGWEPGPGTGRMQEPSLAKLVFSGQTNCALASEEDSTKLSVWEHQLGDLKIFDCTSNPGQSMKCAAPHTAEATAQNATISFTRYVLPGAAYHVSGNQVCYLNDGLERRCGSDEASYGKCHSWTTERVEVPPILRSIQIYSSKAYKSFNTFKAGATLQIRALYPYLFPNNRISSALPVKHTLIIEGPGIPQTEYVIPKYGVFDEAPEVTPTSAGTMRLKVRSQGYTYYTDHYHGGANDDWGEMYDWNQLYPNPTYTEQTLYSTDQTCDEVWDVHDANDPSDDERCPGYGEPIYRAELFDLESEWIEIPVTDDWCVVQPRDPARELDARPDEGCHPCSAQFDNDNPLFGAEDPCSANYEGDSSGDNDDSNTGNDSGNTSGNESGNSASNSGSQNSGTKEEESSGCAAAGVSGFGLGALAFVTLAFRRRNKN